MTRRLLAIQALLACAATLGCIGSPIPNDLVILDVPGSERYALSTEAGIIALDGDDLSVSELPMRYWFRGFEIGDDLVVLRRTPVVSLLKPKILRPERSSLAASEAKPGEALFVAVLTEDREKRPILVEASLYRGGEYGDLLEIEEWFWTPERVARDWTGAGVYAKRKGPFELVGIVNGTLASNPDHRNAPPWKRPFLPQALVPFIGRNAIIEFLPESIDFFERPLTTPRPDMEHGLNRDGTLERTLRRTPD